MDWNCSGAILTPTILCRMLFRRRSTSLSDNYSIIGANIWLISLVRNLTSCFALFAKTFSAMCLVMKCDPKHILDETVQFLNILTLMNVTPAIIALRSTRRDKSLLLPLTNNAMLHITQHVVLIRFSLTSSSPIAIMPLILPGRAATECPHRS